MAQEGLGRCSGCEGEGLAPWGSWGGRRRGVWVGPGRWGSGAAVVWECATGGTPVRSVGQ
jgi:hypothetical protein